MSRAKGALRVYLERGAKKTFAGALEWPGWSRSGRSEEEAIEALLAYAPRYAKVARLAGQTFAVPGDESTVDVVERIAGGATTDFGAPGAAPSEDDEPLSGRDLARHVALLEASWKAFDAAARSARGRTLRTGPRGGGRTVGKMTDHVLEAEVAYLALLGSRRPKGGEPGERARALRTTVLSTINAVAAGKPVADPSSTKRHWTPRYFVRRAAWHALDHAWEIEDRLPA